MIIGITFLSFLLSYLSPGDPAQILLNNQGVKASEEALQSTRHELGLDRPMIVQYGDWLMDLCKGDMGTSYKSNRPVLSEMTAKIPGTLILTVTALGVTMLLSIPLGVVCRRQSRSPDPDGDLSICFASVLFSGTFTDVFFVLKDKIISGDRKS